MTQYEESGFYLYCDRWPFNDPSRRMAPGIVFRRFQGRCIVTRERTYRLLATFVCYKVLQHRQAKHCTSVLPESHDDVCGVISRKYRLVCGLRTHFILSLQCYCCGWRALSGNCDVIIGHAGSASVWSGSAVFLLPPLD